MVKIKYLKKPIKLFQKKTMRDNEELHLEDENVF